MKRRYRFVVCILALCFMVCTVGVVPASAADYGDGVAVTVPYTHIYDADKNRVNDQFTYRISPEGNAPAPAGSRDGVYYFTVKAVPEGEAVSGQEELTIAFPRPGVYTYDVSSYHAKAEEGFTYESRVYQLNVYVKNKKGSGLIANMVTAVGSDGHKYGRLQLNPGYTTKESPVTVRPITTPEGDGNRQAVVRNAGNNGNAGNIANAQGPLQYDTIENDDTGDTPLSNIVENLVPKATLEREYWSLVNLIAGILTILAAAWMVARYFSRVDTDADEYIIRRGGKWRLAGLVPAVASIVVFLCTENLHNPMGLVDEWTPFMIVVLLINVALGIVMHRHYHDGPGVSEADEVAA